MVLNSELLSRNALDVLSIPIDIVPTLVIAIAVLVIGWVIGWVVEKAIKSIFRALPFFDEALKSVGLEEITKRAGIRINIGKFFGVIFRVFIIFIFLVAALDILNLQTVNEFLTNQVLTYIPSVISAALIMVLGLLFANFFGKVVHGTSRAAKVSSGLAVKITRWSIITLSILVALGELGIANEIINSMIIGIIAAVSLALGLSFGLGGQKAAESFLNKVKDDIEKE